MVTEVVGFLPNPLGNLDKLKRILDEKDIEYTIHFGKMENKLLEIDLNEADEYDFDDFTQNLEYELSEHKIEFPVTLEAVASNWRGQTGYAEAESQSDLMNKISSFDPGYVELFINTSGSQEQEIVNEDSYPLYFTIYTHDVPMGFRMNLKKSGENDG